MPQLYSLDSLSTESDILHAYQPSPYYLFASDCFSRINMEYFWGLPKNCLDLKSSINMITVKPGIRRLLEERRCAILPTHKTLQRIRDFHLHNQKQAIAERKVFVEEFPIQQYEYIMFCLDVSETLFIEDPKQRRPKRYNPPHKSLPHFWSEVHPFCMVYYSTPAICRAACKDNCPVSQSIVDDVGFISRRKNGMVPREFSHPTPTPPPVVPLTFASLASLNENDDPLPSFAVPELCSSRSSTPSLSKSNDFVPHKVLSWKGTLPTYAPDVDQERASSHDPLSEEQPRLLEDTLKPRSPVFGDKDLRRHLCAQDWIILNERQEFMVNPYPDEFFGN